MRCSSDAALCSSIPKINPSVTVTCTTLDLVGWLLSIFSVCFRLLKACEDDGLNVAVPMRMLEVFSSERTYLPFLLDENYVTALIEQILHYMVEKGTEICSVLDLSSSCINVNSIFS